MSNPANDSLLLWKIKGNLNPKSSLFCTEFKISSQLTALNFLEQGTL